MTLGRAFNGGMRRLIALSALLLTVVTACGVGETSSGGPSGPGKPVDPQLLAAPLRDARTGQAFTLADFRDKVVLIEGMAVWCPVCTDQQRNLKAALPALGDGAVVVSLDVDPNENDAIVKRYVERQGWSWRFAVAPPALAQSLATTFGTALLSPPSTPLLVIDPAGAGHLSTGLKGPEAIKQLVERYRRAG